MSDVYPADAQHAPTDHTGKAFTGQVGRNDGGGNANEEKHHQELLDITVALADDFIRMEPIASALRPDCPGTGCSMNTAI